MYFQVVMRVKIIDGFDFILMLFFILSQLSIKSLFILKGNFFFLLLLLDTLKEYEEIEELKITSVRSVSMFYSSLYIQYQAFVKCMVNIHLKSVWLGNKYEIAQP